MILILLCFCWMMLFWLIWVFMILFNCSVRWIFVIVFWSLRFRFVIMLLRFVFIWFVVWVLCVICFRMVRLVWSCCFS